MKVTITRQEEVYLSSDQQNEVTKSVLLRLIGFTPDDHAYIKDGHVYREVGDYHSTWDEKVRKATELDEQVFSLLRELSS